MDNLTITATIQTDPVTVAILHLAGRLDSNTESLLREKAGQLHAEGTRRLLLDLEKLDYVSSAGLCAIHLLYKTFTPAEEIAAWQPGGDVFKSPYFKIANAAPQVYSILNLAGFLHNIPFFNNLNDALDSFK